MYALQLILLAFALAASSAIAVAALPFEAPGWLLGLRDGAIAGLAFCSGGEAMRWLLL